MNNQQRVSTAVPVDVPTMTGLRAIAAGWVVLHHLREPILELIPVFRPIEPILAGGYLGVEIFFVLSGFIISHNYAEKFRSFDRTRYREYVIARVARVYPVHLLTLVLMGLLVIAAASAGVSLTSAGRNTPTNFVANLVLLQAVPEFRPFNWPAWSISCECAAYLLFPLVALGVVRLSRPAAVVAATAAALIGVAGFALIAATGDSWSLSYPMMWWRIAAGFVTGALLWAVWRRGVRSSGVWDIIAVLALAGVATVLVANPNDSVRAFMTFPLLALFVFCCACVTGPLGRLLKARPMLWFGRVSYSLYMTHFIVFLVVKKILPWETLQAGSVSGIAYLACFAVVVVGAAALTYYLVEEPGRRLIRRMSSRAAPMPGIRA